MWSADNRARESRRERKGARIIYEQRFTEPDGRTMAHACRLAATLTNNRLLQAALRRAAEFIEGSYTPPE